MSTSHDGYHRPEPKYQHQCQYYTGDEPAQFRIDIIVVILVVLFPFVWRSRKVIPPVLSFIAVIVDDVDPIYIGDVTSVLSFELSTMADPRRQVPL